MGRIEYERRAVEALRQRLLGPGGKAKKFGEEGTSSRILVEDVRIETAPTGNLIVILYRDLDRPDCLFGWRIEAMEPVSPAQHPGPAHPEEWAIIVSANFQEHILGTPYGLPKNCSPKGINWTG